MSTKDSETKRKIFNDYLSLRLGELRLPDDALESLLKDLNINFPQPSDDSDLNSEQVVEWYKNSILNSIREVLSKETLFPEDYQKINKVFEILELNQEDPLDAVSNSEYLNGEKGSEVDFLNNQESSASEGEGGKDQFIYESIPKELEGIEKVLKNKALVALQSLGVVKIKQNGSVSIDYLKLSSYIKADSSLALKNQVIAYLLQGILTSLISYRILNIFSTHHVQVTSKEKKEVTSNVLKFVNEVIDSSIGNFAGTLEILHKKRRSLLDSLIKDEVINSDKKEILSNNLLDVTLNLEDIPLLKYLLVNYTSSTLIAVDDNSLSLNIPLTKDIQIINVIGGLAGLPEKIEALDSNNILAISHTNETTEPPPEVVEDLIIKDNDFTTLDLALFVKNEVPLREAIILDYFNKKGVLTSKQGNVVINPKYFNEVIKDIEKLQNELNILVLPLLVEEEINIRIRYFLNNIFFTGNKLINIKDRRNIRKSLKRLAADYIINALNYLNTVNDVNNISHDIEYNVKLFFENNLHEIEEISKESITLLQNDKIKGYLGASLGVIPFEVYEKNIGVEVIWDIYDKKLEFAVRGGKEGNALYSIDTLITYLNSKIAYPQNFFVDRPMNVFAGEIGLYFDKGNIVREEFSESFLGDIISDGFLDANNVQVIQLLKSYGVIEANSDGIVVVNRNMYEELLQSEGGKNTVAFIQETIEELIFPKILNNELFLMMADLTINKSAVAKKYKVNYILFDISQKLSSILLDTIYKAEWNAEEVKKNFQDQNFIATIKKEVDEFIKSQKYGLSNEILTHIKEEYINTIMDNFMSEDSIYKILESNIKDKAVNVSVELNMTGEEPYAFTVAVRSTGIEDGAICTYTPYLVAPQLELAPWMDSVFGINNQNLSQNSGIYMGIPQSDVCMEIDSIFLRQPNRLD